MSVFSKILLAGSLRLLLVATAFIATSFGSSVSEVRGQIANRQETRSPRPQEALPDLLPVTDFEFTPLNFPNPASEQLSNQGVKQASLVQDGAQAFNSVGSTPNFQPLPNFFHKENDRPVDPHYPRSNQTARALSNDAAQANQNDFAPANSTINTAADEIVTHYETPTVNRTRYGAPSDSVVNSPNQFKPANVEVPHGNSHFEPSKMSEQIIGEQNSLVLPTVPPIFAQPANQTNADSGLLSAYQSRPILQADERFNSTLTSTLPQGFQPWWAQQNKTALGLKVSPIQVSLDSLIHRALKNSPHIQVAATQPHIQQAVLLEESSRFDWLAFLESTYDDQNDPVGNTLTTGNNDSRLTQQEWSAEGGLRRQTRTGGEFELTQRVSTLQNNSRFLLPQDQGLSRLVLNYRQPLLRGRGQAVNESLIVLANINLNSASDEFLSNIQQHLTDLTETYWELVRARSELLQRNGLLIAAERILDQLEGRSEVDAMERQVFRARSAVAKRKAEIARSVTSVKNAESRIRLLVNDEEIISAARMELVPVDSPNLEYLNISLGDAISTALSNRPDISRSIREIKATSVQLGIARNELLPKLDLLVGSYVAGLDDNFDIPGSFGNQFSDGRPGFNIGFEFETPIGNRAAQARQKRRVWEANRAMHQFRAIVESGLTEVELAVREVQTAHQEMSGRYHAMVAAQKESSFLNDRWKTLPDENDSVILLLENLLDSQERLVNEESAFAKAQFDYSVAVVKLKQATGTLFQVN